VGQVEIWVNAVKHNNVKFRVLLDDGDEIAKLGEGRRSDGVDRRMVERHMAVSGLTAIDPEVRPRPVVFNRTHVELPPNNWPGGYNRAETDGKKSAVAANQWPRRCEK